MTRTMDGWLVSVTAGVPNCGPRGRVGGGGEGDGDGHHYQHYVARRKIPLAVMVGMYCNRVGPQLWPLGVSERKIPLHWL